jgi:hypothetical protein
MSHRSLVLVLSLGLSACGGDDGGGGVPAAPTNLAGSVLSGGAHLTWTDNSDNETEFMIMRMEMGSTAGYSVVAMPPFNTATYHDAPLTAGKTYMYMVHAVNDAGDSQPSNEVTVAIP